MQVPSSSPTTRSWSQAHRNQCCGVASTFTACDIASCACHQCHRVLFAEIQREVSFRTVQVCEAEAVRNASLSSVRFLRLRSVPEVFAYDVLVALAGVGALHHCVRAIVQDQSRDNNQPFRFVFWDTGEFEPTTRTRRPILVTSPRDQITNCLKAKASDGLPAHQWNLVRRPRWFANGPGYILTVLSLCCVEC